MTLEGIKALFREGTVLSTRQEGGKRHALHIIHKPTVSERGFYHQTVSFSAFRERENNRFYEDYLAKKLAGFYYVGEWNTSQWSIMQDCDRTTFERHNLGPIPCETMDIVEHESVWAFYRYIGYDYKKKIFL